MEPQVPVNSLLDLSGVSILVTGASGGIGDGIARRLSEAGATIIAHAYRNVAKAEKLVDELGGGDVVSGDLSEESVVDRIVARCRPDAVVNNAATQPVHPLADMPVDAWRRVLASNLDSAFLITRTAAALWRDAGSPGSIVNIASIEGKHPAEGHAHYATSKAGLIMFTQASALEFGRDGIRINAVSPGLIDRPGLEADWPEGVARWRTKAPLARLGVSNDVADAVLFLLSPAARWITGVNLVVDGGMSAQNKW